MDVGSTRTEREPNSMNDGLTDVAGLLVGHAEDIASCTGCTVVLCPDGAVVGVDVRGSAPGTRETDLCRPGTLVERAHGILLTGGSAFGLDAASGVMRWLWERGMGLDTGVARIPIVPAAVIFDLAVGTVAWPDGAMAYRACEAAGSGHIAEGSVGAGTGASVGKLLGRGAASKGGIGTASLRVRGVTVAALMVVNAVGDVVHPATGGVIAGTRDPVSGELMSGVDAVMGGGVAEIPFGNTTIGVVATDATLSKWQVNHLARLAHDGLARAIRPCHTMFDGDTIFGLATDRHAGETDALFPLLEIAVVDVTARAVVRAVQQAVSLGGLQGLAD
jgi:L-aminopeptidase/D-esterase-like protein